MKKTVAFIVCLILACALFCGCGAKTKVLKETDEFIVINPSADFVGKTLEECMNDLKERGKLDYKIESEMVVSINNIDNPADYSSCWMLYTDDAENSNAAWDTIEYNGKTYSSSSLGATALTIAEGCAYIWVYTEF